MSLSVHLCSSGCLRHYVYLPLNVVISLGLHLLILDLSSVSHSSSLSPYLILQNNLCDAITFSIYFTASIPYALQCLQFTY